MKAAPAEIFANSPSLYIFGFGIFVKGIMQLFFSAKRKSTRVFRAEQQCVDRILCNAEHFFTGFMLVFDDKRNFSPAANAAPSIVPTAANSFAPSNGASMPKVKRTSSGRTVKFRIPS